MKTHELKLRLEFCDAVLNGEKTFEIRKNDRGYQKGDHIKFIPTKTGVFDVPANHKIENKEYEITYVLSGWNINEGYVIFSIKEIDDEDDESTN